MPSTFVELASLFKYLLTRFASKNEVQMFKFPESKHLLPHSLCQPVFCSYSLCGFRVWEKRDRISKMHNDFNSVVVVVVVTCWLFVYQKQKKTQTKNTTKTKAPKGKRNTQNVKNIIGKSKNANKTSKNCNNNTLGTHTLMSTYSNTRKNLRRILQPNLL